MNLLNNYYLKKNKLIINSTDLLKKTKSKNTNLTAINCNLLASKSQHNHSAYDYRKKINSELCSPNIFLYINSLFYGSCHDIAFFMSYLLEINGIESRIIHLSNKNIDYKKKITHVAIEAYYDKAWHFFDPSLNLFFTQKGNKKILSANEIKYNENLKSNKKISINKLKNNKKDSVYYFKNKEIFKNQTSNYLSLFKNIKLFRLFDQDYSYKKKYMKQYGLIKHYTFREFIYYDRDFYITKSNLNFGIIDSNIVKSSKFCKFKNFLYVKKINTDYLNINDFPFLILDLQITCEQKKSKCMILINGKRFTFLNQEKWIFKDILKNKKIFKDPIRSIYLKSDTKIKQASLLFLKSNIKI